MGVPTGGGYPNIGVPTGGGYPNSKVDVFVAVIAGLVIVTTVLGPTDVFFPGESFPLTVETTSEKAENRTKIATAAIIDAINIFNFN